MKKIAIQVTFTLFCLLTGYTTKAQEVITEYLIMSDTFQLDLKNKKVQKMVYAKGVLDVDWNWAKRTLAVSYSPKETRIENVMEVIDKVTKMPASAFKEAEAKAVPITPF